MYRAIVIPQRQERKGGTLPFDSLLRRLLLGRESLEDRVGIRVTEMKHGGCNSEGLSEWIILSQLSTVAQLPRPWQLKQPSGRSGPCILAPLSCHTFPGILNHLPCRRQMQPRSWEAQQRPKPLSRGFMSGYLLSCRWHREEKCYPDRPGNKETVTTFAKRLVLEK